MYILTADSTRLAEQSAMERHGETSASLMETAGTACAGIIAGKSGHIDRKTVVILCGKGNNGGDGFVAARRLWDMGGRNVFVVLAFGKPKGEVPRGMYDRLGNYPVTVFDYTENPDGALNIIANADILVDAIFGIGFKGELTGAAAELTAAANENTRAAKFAVDIPSGIDADSASQPGKHFLADCTMTIFALKPALANKPASLACGRIEVVPLVLSDDELAPFAEDYSVLTPPEIKNLIRPRDHDAHKGDFGKVLTVTGSRTMTGCVNICSQAAVEAGAGLVTAAFPDAIYSAVAPNIAEQTMLPLPSDNGALSERAAGVLAEKAGDYTAVAIGCGIGTSFGAVRTVSALTENYRGTLILDADALNCLSGRPDILAESDADIVITPHPGEMARLINKTPAEVNSDRIGIARDFAEKYGVCAVLKGADTVIAAPDGRVAVNPTGNPGMARGGSGDALTGLIAGLVPQTADVFDAARAGAYIHGGAGDYVARKYGILAPTATRIIKNLHRYLRNIL
ncbi:MAG: NAD(P)H-hydrate dehydratase [Clostridia bacterium]|nr:NAD(P)H-hydrate dehydratase [Clostridia bacterium]